MEKIILLFSAATICSGIFFPLINLPNRKTMVNVCIYSVNPGKYAPKCFLCPNDVYPFVLQTCLKAAAIPSNVSFTQALCLEQNCAISRGKRSISSSSEEDNSLEWKEHDSNSVELIQLPNKPRPGGNGSSNVQDDDGPVEIVLQEEAYASDDSSFDYDDSYDVD